MSNAQANAPANAPRTKPKETTMKGFDLYEQWRSCVYEVSLFVAPSWDALEIWERRAWEELSYRVSVIERKS